MSDEARVVLLSIALLIVQISITAVGASLGRQFAGRPIVGAILGFVFGPLGWLMVFCFIDRRRRCAACRTVAGPTDVACGRCGRTLPRPIPNANSGLAR
jgi:hypothetical protein